MQKISSEEYHQGKKSGLFKGLNEDGKPIPSGYGKFVAMVSLTNDLIEGLGQLVKAPDMAVLEYLCNAIEGMTEYLQEEIEDQIEKENSSTNNHSDSKELIAKLEALKDQYKFNSND